jgi:hypothetical protein
MVKPHFAHVHQHVFSPFFCTSHTPLSQSNIPKAPPVKLFNYKTHTTEPLAFKPSTGLQCLRSNNDAIQTAE